MFDRRSLFRWTVATGLRAHGNRTRHYFLKWWYARVAPLNAQPYLVETDLGLFRVRLWLRARPHGGATAFRYGMLCARLVKSPISARMYRRVCGMGHFGDAHLEGAFRFANDECQIFALKNVARDYCALAGLPDLAKALSFGGSRREPRWIYHVVAAGLSQRFTRVTLASPGDCVQLAVRTVLLGEQPEKKLQILLLRYQRLAMTIQEQPM